MSGGDLAVHFGPRTLTASVLGPEEGRPALFFHGAPGCRLQALRLEAAATARRIRLIAIDRPGCGRTSPTSGNLAEQLVQDVEAILDALDLERAAAMAVSGGVAAVLLAAAALPGRIDRVVIASGLGLLANRGNLAGAGVSQRMLSIIARNSVSATRVALAFPYLMSRLAPITPEHDGNQERRNVLIREVRETFLQGTRGPAEDMSTASRVEVVDLAAVDQRVIAWHGSSDRHAPLAAMKALVERLPSASLHVVEGADHFLFESRAELILAELDPGK